MIRSVRKTAPLVLALLLALAAAASAGDNASATFSLTSAEEFTGIGPGETVTVQIAAAGLVGVKQIEIRLAVSPASAFDLAATTYEYPAGFISPGAPEVIGTDTVRAAAANLMSATTGDLDMGTITLTTAAGFTAETEATITVAKISVGPSSQERDVFGAAALGMSITVNPPAPPVIEPTLSASSAADMSKDFSAVGDGDEADGSDGEAALGVVFTDNTGAAVAGQAITWTISNDGGETVYVLAPSTTSVAAGAEVTVSGTSDADGAATLTLDAEGDKFAASTSVSVTVSTTAPNSDAVSRELSVDFSVTWDVPVPAELASFAGQITADQEVLLIWGVASQSSNLGWEVYRSVDDVLYERVSGLIAGEGTTDAFRTYEFVDADAPVAEVVFYHLRQIDLDGSATRSEVIQIAFAPTAVELSMLPTATALAQNFPNPFNPETNIRFDLSGATTVTLTVYDAAGQAVRSLVAGEFMEAGTYNLTWDGRNGAGDMVGSGIYFYEMRAGSFTLMKKMTLLQ